MCLKYAIFSVGRGGKQPGEIARDAARDSTGKEETCADLWGGSLSVCTRLRQTASFVTRWPSPSPSRFPLSSSSLLRSIPSPSLLDTSRLAYALPTTPPPGRSKRQPTKNPPPVALRPANFTLRSVSFFASEKNLSKFSLSARRTNSSLTLDGDKKSTVPTIRAWRWLKSKERNLKNPWN